MNNIHPTHIYKGTPYLCATIKELWPYYQTTDDRKKWFGFTRDLKKVAIGGVATEAQLKEIIDASDAMNETLNYLP